MHFSGAGILSCIFCLNDSSRSTMISLVVLLLNTGANYVLTTNYKTGLALQKIEVKHF